MIEVQILSRLKAATGRVFIRVATTSRLSWMTTRGSTIVHDQSSYISSFLVRETEVKMWIRRKQE